MGSPQAAITVLYRAVRPQLDSCDSQLLRISLSRLLGLGSSLGSAGSNWSEMICAFLAPQSELHQPRSQAEEEEVLPAARSTE